MDAFDYPSGDQNTAPQPPFVESPQVDTTPPVGITPPQVLAQEAAAGSRGAAWRLLHWIMENDPRAIVAVSSTTDDRLARNLLEFIALGTWAGKAFVLPEPLRSPLARTHLRTLFLPGSGMDFIRAENVLLSFVHDRRPAVREEAIHILGLLGSVSATPAMIDALHDHSAAVRVQAAKALGRSGNVAAVPALVNALHGADEAMSSQIFSALVHIGSGAVPVLVQESQNNSTWIRWNSFRALSAIGDYRALPTLVSGLSDIDRSVAWMAAKGLLRFGKACIEPMLRMLMTTATSPWVAETSSYVFHELYDRDLNLRPYLEPVVQSMHGVYYQVGTPVAARNSLSQLTQAGLIALPS